MDQCKTNVVLSHDHIILTKDSRTLWCDRKDATLTAGYAFHRDSTLEYVDVGKVWGIVGKICFFTDGDWKLVVVSQASYVGELPHGGEVYCVEKIDILPLTGDLIAVELPEMGLEQSTSLSSTRPLSPSQGTKTKEMREREKVEKRLTEALLNMFNDSRSFYFCLNCDLTQSLQRQTECTTEHKQLPLWKQMDERFFWNKWMLTDLLDEKINDEELSTPWILPLIQGYVEMRQIPVLCEDTPNILQPGWSAQYREERDKILQECLDESKGPKKGFRRQESVEIEMQDMASMNRPGMMIPMKELRPLSGSGYESDSEASGSEEEDGRDNFSPVEFTSKVVEREAGEVKVIPALKSSEIKDMDRGDRTNVGRDTEMDSAEQIVMGSQCRIQISRASEQLTLDPSFLANEVSTTSPSSEQAPTRDDTECHTSPGDPSSGNRSNDSGGEEAGSELSPAGSFPDRDKSPSPNSSSAVFFMSQDIPDVEDGVLIDVFKSSSEGSPEKRAMHVSADSQELLGEPTVYQFPSDSSPVNPFLESEQQAKERPSFTLAIISRRSCRRAGTRYKRRGVDPEGHVANYVETELVLRCGSHVVSYVIVRGSVPVFWSQPGNKYRPLPIIEKSIDETQQAFQKHFDSQLELFKEIVAVNLVKQTGREKLVGDAFEQHVVQMDNPLLSYVAFDFHQSYKENQNLALHKLLLGTAEFVKKFKFCWIDSAQSYGPLCRQEGVFRVNCMDCLDRTNVVESYLSREVLQISLQKLGMIPFDEKLGGATLISYQEMWANNGDVISKQYAGTAAMKGDITRYGERKFKGLMKDGYNSAHRYYLNVFRDSYRQVIIDLMQGVNPFEAFMSLPRSLQGMDELDDGLLQSTSSIEPVGVSSTAWSLERETAMAEMLNVCKDELFPSMSKVPLSPAGLYGWVLMEAAGYSFLGDNKEEEPCVVLHSRAEAQLCVAKFSMESKKVQCFLRIPMSQIQKIVIGQLGIILRNTKRMHMRIHYSLTQDSSHYFTFTTANNSISIEEDRGILVSIADLLARMQPSLIVQEQKLSKKKSPPHQGVIYLVLPETCDSAPRTSISLGDFRSQDLENRISEGRDSDEVGEEPSLSAPSSPKLRSPKHEKRRHSCDDLLSPTSSTRPSPDPAHLQEPQPSITVTTPSRKNHLTVPTQLFQLDSDESDSESDLELSDAENLRTNLTATNSLGDLGKGSGGSSEEEEVTEEAKEPERATQSAGGRFSKFKGKFLQTVKSSTSTLLSRPRSRSPGPANKSDSTQNRRSPSPVSNEGDISRASSSGLQLSAKLRFSPSLFRKMRKNSPTGPTEEELSRAEAQRNCRSRFIYIS